MRTSSKCKIVHRSCKLRQSKLSINIQHENESLVWGAREARWKEQVKLDASTDTMTGAVQARL
eukprot:1146914-Pelagomonas_calceolata.AAC.2